MNHNYDEEFRYEWAASMVECIMDEWHEAKSNGDDDVIPLREVGRDFIGAALIGNLRGFWCDRHADEPEDASDVALLIDMAEGHLFPEQDAERYHAILKRDGYRGPLRYDGFWPREFGDGTPFPQEYTPQDAAMAALGMKV